MYKVPKHYPLPSVAVIASRKVKRHLEARCPYCKEMSRTSGHAGYETGCSHLEGFVDRDAYFKK